MVGCIYSPQLSGMKAYHLLQRYFCLSSPHSSCVHDGSSQTQGEDGAISYIFHCIGVTDKFYVEFGTENGSETNSRVLREHYKWTGLLMDGGHTNSAINLQKVGLALDSDLTQETENCESCRILLREERGQETLNKVFLLLMWH